MAERLEEWAPRLSAALHRLPTAAQQALATRADLLARLARRHAPRASGDLQREIQPVIRKGAAGATMPARYATLETGGVIMPRRARWLAVPIGPAPAALSGPRADSDLFTLTARDGRKFLATRRGAGVELRWRLLPSLRLQARGFMARAQREVAAGTPTALLDALEREVDA